MKQFLNRLKEKIGSKESAKKICLVMVFLCFLLVGFVMRNVIFDIGDDDSVADDEIGETEVTEIEIEQEGHGEEDVSYAVAADTMQLSIDMPQQIKERIDYTAFVKAFEAYLIEQDFWSDTTTATSDYVLVEDFKTGALILTFYLNDYSATTVTVTVENGGTFTFTHY